MAKLKASSIGAMLFLLGVAIALVTGAFSVPYSAIGLGVLGALIGFLNIQKKESLGYIVAVLALTVTSGIVYGMLDYNNILKNVFLNFTALFGVGAFVVALKVIYDVAKK